MTYDKPIASKASFVVTQQTVLILFVVFEEAKFDSWHIVSSQVCIVDASTIAILQRKYILNNSLNLDQ